MNEKNLTKIDKPNNLILLHKQINDLNIDLQIERINDSLKLTITTINSKTQECPKNLQLLLYSNGRELNSSKESEAIFYLKFKKYFIKIFVKGKQIGIITLRLHKDH